MGLNEQARKDLQSFTTDLNGWGEAIRLTTPDGVSSIDLIGLTSKHHLGLDSDGNLMNVRNAHCSFSEKQCIDAGFVVRDNGGNVSLDGYFATFKDSRGSDITYKIREWFPDETLGFIVCILGDYVTPVMCTYIATSTPFGEEEGTIEVNVSQGTPPFTYSLYDIENTLVESVTNSLTSFTFDELPPGAYRVVVKDKNNTVCIHENATVVEDANNSFVTTHDVDIAGASGVNMLTLPLHVGGTYSFTVDWGDGNTDVITAYNQAEITHVYSTGGIKTVTITGTCEGWYYNNAGDKDKLITIVQWGVDFKLGNSGNYFYGCSNLSTINDSSLVMTGTTNLDFAWRDCVSLTSFPLIDTSSVTSMNNTWQFCSGLTSFPLLDISSLTDLTNTWNNCTGLLSFPLLDTSGIDTFINTWQFCTSLTSFPSIDTSTVTVMVTTWDNCSSLTSFPEIDTSSVTRLIRVWGSCSLLTTLTNVGSWDVSNLTEATNMLLNTTLSTTNYDDLITGWSTQTVQSGVAFHGGNSTYSVANQAARDVLTDPPNNWTITDGGAI